MENEITNLHLNNNLSYEEAKESVLRDFRVTCRLGIQLLNEFNNLRGDRIDDHYFITIRPDETKISFPDFYHEIYKLVQRKCFINFKLSFEQKGTNEESMGKGFHVHIIAYMKQPSKKNVLRDIYSTVKSYTAYNCIDVRKLLTQQDIDNVDKYIVEYISEDDHKIATRDCDILWREKNNLKNIYENIFDLVLPNKSTNILLSLVHTPSASSSPGDALDMGATKVP